MNKAIAEKMRKRVIFYLLVTLLVVVIGLVFFVFLNEREVIINEKSCFLSGGEWIEFPDTCANTCQYERGSDVFCAQALTFSCLCEEGNCWDGENCVPI